MSYLFPNYSRKPFEIVSGQGLLVQDQKGKTYLDFTSGIGVMNLGHHHPAVEAALAKQAGQIWHMPNLYQSQLQEEVAQALAGELDYVSFFCNSGAEANEAAIKLARKYTGRSQLLTFQQSFHGRTYGAMTATGQATIHAGFEPLVPDFIYGEYNDQKALDLVTEQTAAVMVELIQGEGGVIVAERSWIQQLAKRCQAMGALLIVDEVQTGIGRTGSLFAFEQFGIQPDIFTLAKGLGNGLPVGAMLGKRELASAFGPGSHGTTFGGNKLALAAAKAVLETMGAPGFLATVGEKGEYLRQGINAIQSAKIVAVRGLGLMVGIQLVSEEVLASVTEQLEAKGLLSLRAGKTVLRLLPALTVSEAELQQALALLAEVLV